MIHRNFFDEGVDPSKRRCRDRRGSGGSAGTAKGSAPRTLQAGWRSITLGFRPKLPGMEAATPVIRSQVHAFRGVATAAEPIECERMEKKMRKGTAEGGGVTYGKPKRDCIGSGWSLFPTATRIASTCECRDIQQEPT